MNLALDAPGALANKCRQGLISARGLKNGEGDMCEMRPEDWDGRTILDAGPVAYDKEVCAPHAVKVRTLPVRAGIEGNPRAAWWSNLHFGADEIQRLWPKTIDLFPLPGETPNAIPTAIRDALAQQFAPAEDRAMGRTAPLVNRRANIEKTRQLVSEVLDGQAPDTVSVPEMKRRLSARGHNVGPDTIRRALGRKR